MRAGKYGIITTAWLLYLRIERFLRHRRNPPRICRRPMAAVRPWYNMNTWQGSFGPGVNIYLRIERFLRNCRNPLRICRNLRKGKIKAMDTEYLKEKRILLVDDEEELLDMVCSILMDEGYRHIQRAGTVKEALEAAAAFRPELAILDVMLPDGDGFVLFEKLKKMGDYPVLFLTARGEDEDKFKGLGLGADDYMVKPFLPKELILRVGVILKRSYKNEDPLVRLAGSQIDFGRAEVVKEGEHISLTAKEFELLSALYRNAGRIVTIDALCEAAWGDNPYGYENSLMAHIRRIREKIEKDPSHPASLVTVKGLGYKLMVEGK